ncbi:MAG: NUDIX domain-containing protein [Halolamina sp.]
MSEVVTAFLRHCGEVLLLRRGDAVGTYPGRWGGVSGYVEPETDDPVDDARRELREEVGAAAPTLVRRGEPLSVADDGRSWRVHPFLFETDDRTVDPNEEVADWEWAPPPAMSDRETVPKLWAAYRRVGPTPATVAADERHGAAYLSVRTLEALRDGAAAVAAGGGADDEHALADLVADLRTARPGMAAPRNRLHRVLAEVDPAADRERLVERAHEAVDAALTADAAAGTAAADALPERVATLSYSETVRAALRAAAPAEVVVAESCPGGEGVDLARALRADGLDATLVPDAALAHVLGTGRVDAAVVGADAVGPDGRVVNKVGTRGLALACDAADRPLYVVAAGDKVAPAPASDWEPALGDRSEAVGVDGDEVPAETPLYDATPADCEAVTLVTEDGPLDGDGSDALARRHRERAAAAEAWLER